MRLDEVLAEVGDVLGYLYDFGDAWDHELRLEDIREVEPTEAVRVLAGAAACPMENAGGIEAWNAYVHWLVDGDPDGLDDEWLRDLVEWVPIDLDATHFDVSEAHAAAAAAVLTTEQLSARIPLQPDIAALLAVLPEEGVRLLGSLCVTGPRLEVDHVPRCGHCAPCSTSCVTAST